MARPLRIEYPGISYHVNSRGNERLPFCGCFYFGNNQYPFVLGQIKNEAVYHLAAATLSKMEKVVDYA